MVWELWRFEYVTYSVRVIDNGEYAMSNCTKTVRCDTLVRGGICKGQIGLHSPIDIIGLETMDWELWRFEYVT